MGDLGSIPGLGRSPREGKGYPLQYSGLENFMDCIVHGVAKCQLQVTERLSRQGFWFFFQVFILMNFGCAGSLLLHGLFSTWRNRGLLSSCSMRVSHCSGLSCFGAQALGCVNLSICGTVAQKPWLPDSGAQDQCL